MPHAPPYVRVFSTLMIGEGLRFNNPYRLRTSLGRTPQSLSLTPLYYDLGIGALGGQPDGLQHGAHVSYSASFAGVHQDVVTPSYVALYRGPSSWLFYGRAGVPLLLTPDFNVGGELAAGCGYFLRAGLGMVANLIFDAFYGAGTAEAKQTFYPVVSGQVGFILDYEFLP